MVDVMRGVRILEVAEQFFVPAASAMLADLGAEVIKVERVDQGDALRGVLSEGSVAAGFQQANRGKRSLALNLARPQGRDILYRLAATSDVFMTNKLAAVRHKLQLDVETIRAHNPNIIYVRGTGQEVRGPEADRGSYDVLGFWHRTGMSMNMSTRSVPAQYIPGPAFGDSVGSLAVAAGTMGALFHRERTGEATVVDTSLLSTGMWAMGWMIGLATMAGRAPDWPLENPNPLMRSYVTKDDRWVALSCPQAGRFWAPLCEVVGRPELAADARFADHASLMTNSVAATALVAEIFAARTAADWRGCLERFSGAWSMVQDTWEVVSDPQVVANGYLTHCETPDGRSFDLVDAPLQFDEEPSSPSRPPEYNEHGDAILAELGFDWDAIVDLKVSGVVG